MRSANVVEELSLEAETLGSCRSEAGLEEAIEKIFTRLRDPVYRYLLVLLGSPEEAEDLTQEVFLRLYGDLERGRGVKRVRAWIFRVAHNAAVDHWRKKRTPEDAPPAPVESCQTLRDPSPGAEEQMLRREDRLKLQAAFGRLSRQERQCIWLRAEGLRYREIAGVLNLSISSVQTFLGRAIQKLGSGMHG